MTMLLAIPPGLGRRVAAAGLAAALALLPQRSATAAGPLDIDGNGAVDALTDGLLLLRYMMGIRGAALTANALGPGATRSAADIQTAIASLISQPPVGTGLPATCSLAQYPDTAAQAVTQGTMIDLAIQCTAGFPPTSCTWTAGISSTACAVRIPAPAATTTISVVPGNPYGTGASVNTTVHVQGGGGGGTVGQNFCTAADNLTTFTWPAGGQVRLTATGFENQIIAYKLVVPMTFSPPLDITHLGFVHVAESPNTPPTPREFTVSKNACDFQSGNYIYNGMGYAIASPTMNFTTNNPNGYLAAGGDFNINSGDTVYFNFRNSNNGVPACNTSSCDMLFDFATPNRY